MGSNWGTVAGAMVLLAVCSPMVKEAGRFEKGYAKKYGGLKCSRCSSNKRY